jgi:hypothetical protein
VLPNNVKENNPFATANAIQVRIDENVRMLAELHGRWEREDEMARKMKVCTKTTRQQVFWHYSSSRHQQVLWRCCRGGKRRLL